MATFLPNLRLPVLLFSIATLFHTLQAQNCANSVALAQGYTTSISSVTTNANGSHTIVLTVVNNGCAGCKKLNSFTVQAAPGTYSNVSVQVLSGAFTWANISMGPTLSGTTMTGFRINNANGMGNGQAAAFSVTYTLTGPFQTQQLVLKTSSVTLNATFTPADFQAVLDCLNPPNAVIFPYFDPYANKLYDIIGVELRSLCVTYMNTGTYISDDIFQILGNSVRVSIRTKPGQHANAVNLLLTPTYGLVQELNDPTNNLINGTIPILNLLSLNSLPTLLVSARPIYAALHNAGLITSQGDTALRSFRAREVFGVDGQGIKVGVLSDSYNTILGNPAADDVLKGDLPGATNPDHPTPVQVLQDFPFGTRSDEGRAMLQIVHDVAPSAELAFRTGFLGALDFANGIRELEQAGCDVIVDDISYISEPFFRDGVVAQAVDEVKALGVSYFSAAGNFGTNSWQGTFAPVAAPAGVVGQAHNFASGFGGSDILQNITLYEGEYTVVFQWDDGTPGATTNSDFDIYLANTNGNTLFGFNRMNIGGDPAEILPFVVTADSVQSNIVIVRESGSGAATLKYIVYRGLLKINEYGGLNASTLTGQANAAGAIAVGAVLYTNTPEYSGITPTVASFSSRGGTPVNGVYRLKPEITAPNGVNTSVDLGGVNYDGDAFPNFFGTSAAAPHAAGIAALLSEARTKYYGDVLSPDGVKGILQNTALDMNTPGYDVATGAGFILADSALKDLANPSPYIYAIHYDTTLTPGVDTLLLTIYGEYLSSSSTVWLDGAPLTNGVVIQGDSAIITIVHPFNALYPAIQVYNPPMAGTNGTDGGLSNPLYFTTKETILVRVDDKSKVYGEVLPQFTATYTLESVDNSLPLASAGLAPNELDRILAIDLTTIATAQSNVGLWGISGDPTDPLRPNSNVPATDPLDISILQQYNVVFDNGLLTIDPADLNITPRDTTVVYNDSIAGIGFNYVFNNGSGVIPMIASDSLAILNAVKSTHGIAMVNAAALVRGIAMVNNDGDPLLSDSLLSNFSFMISQAVSSTRGIAMVNGELIDPEEFYTAAALTNTESRLVRGVAMVNGYSLVRGIAMVNTVDSLGNITNTTPLTNSGSLVNNSGLLNSTTITLNSNANTLVILGDGDIAILSGDSAGDVTIRSVNVITGNTVGTHLIVPGTFLSNNFNVTYGLGHLTILPDTAEFSIAANSLTQTYDGTPKSVVVTVLPDSVAYAVTYNGSTTAPVNAGSYAVHVAVNDSNYVGSLDATLVIQPGTAQFTITPSTLTQTYNASPRSVAVSVVPAGLAYTVTYNGSATPPVNAGSYAVLVTVNNANYVGTMSATLVVQKAPATATTGTYVINKNAPLPTFTATYSGFLNGQTASVVTSVSFTVSPNYTGNAGVYQIIVNATAANYTFTSVNGTLYVNPKGPGTKQVKPNFVCRENLSSPGAGGFMYIAHFNYENQNATPVYIPVGPKNSTSGAAHLATGQPVLFLPGGGTWAVPFNNVGQLTWQITSNKNNGTSGSIPANTSNVVCPSNFHSPIFLPADTSMIGQEARTDIRVYPNPSTGNVFLEFTEGQAAGASFEVYNYVGAKCAVNTRRASDQLVELDLSSFGKGLYVITVIQGDNRESRTVIIE
ncbi:MAG: S8 family serine peptidase [Flavobacteriales bacterium]|nr:S8 family serine peptidase [Flavobacteriales bacterium]